MIASYRVSDAERDAGLPFAETLEAACRLFLEQGCLVLENALSREFVGQLSAAYFAGIGAHDDATLLGNGLVVGRGRVKQPLPLTPPFDHPRFWAHPIFCSLLEVWLGSKFLLDVCSVVTALPGAEAQVPHRDNAFPYGYQQISADMPPFAITLAMPLVDFTPATGTTELFCGSHRELRGSDAYSSNQGLQPFMRMGDVYLMDYRLVHGGTPNLGTGQRPMASLLYTRPWYVDTLNHLEQGLPSLVVPPELLGRLSPLQRYLLSRAPGAVKWQAPLGDKPPAAADARPGIGPL